jgi:hypothetical protein
MDYIVFSEVIADDKNTCLFIETLLKGLTLCKHKHASSIDNIPSGERPYYGT